MFSPCDGDGGYFPKTTSKDLFDTLDAGPSPLNASITSTKLSRSQATPHNTTLRKEPYQRGLSGMALYEG